MKTNSAPKNMDAEILSDPKEKVIQGLFISAEHWQSDLKFFEEEIRFLTNLIDKYFIWLSDEKNIDSTRTLASKLIKLEKMRRNLDESVIIYLKHLTDLIKNRYTNYGYSYENEHRDLEIMLTTFLKDFRQAKKEIFKLTEHVIDSEKIKHLLGAS